MKKIGNLYGKPVVIGDPNEVKEHQLLAYDTTPIEVPPHESGETWRILLEDLLYERNITGADILYEAIVKAIQNKTYKIIFNEGPSRGNLPTVLTINAYNNYYNKTQETFVGGMINVTLLSPMKRNGIWGNFTTSVLISQEEGFGVTIVKVDVGVPA